MNKLFILLSVLLLTGCIGSKPVVVKQVWPDVPKDLIQACPDLKTVKPDTAKLSEIIEVVADNYSQYYDCKAKVDDWITWYNSQRDIYNGK